MTLDLNLDDPRFDNAERLQVLLCRDGVEVACEGYYTLVIGAVTVTFTPTGVDIAFIDSWSASQETGVITLATGAFTIAALGDIVTGLARFLAVAR